MLAVTARVVNWVPFPVEKPIIWRGMILDATSVGRIKFCLWIPINLLVGHDTVAVLSYGIIRRCRSGKSLFIVFLSVEENRCSCSAVLPQSHSTLRLKDGGIKHKQSCRHKSRAESTVAMHWFGSGEPSWTFSMTCSSQELAIPDFLDFFLCHSVVLEHSSKKFNMTRLSSRK